MSEQCLHVFHGKEAERYKAFRHYHYVKCNNARHVIVLLSGTGLGEAIRVKCPICGEEKDITDCDAW